MKVGVLRETYPGERRVALIPDIIPMLLKKGIKEYIRSRNLALRYDIFHHASASSANLQIVDYISWAIFRKYERGEDRYYNQVKAYVLDEDIMTKNREVNHYEK